MTPETARLRDGVLDSDACVQFDAEHIALMRFPAAVAPPRAMLALAIHPMTLACYDFVPNLSNSQVYKQADWYEKTQKFQRAAAKGEANLEDLVNAFLEELAEPSPEVPSAAAIDTDVANQWQYEDVAENLTR